MPINVTASMDGSPIVGIRGRRWSHCLIACFFVFGMSLSSRANDFQEQMQSLVEDACIHCHDASTDTRLNFEELSYELADSDTFAMWVNVFDRVRLGEMPPPSEDRPDQELLQPAMAGLETSLRSTSEKEQAALGRVRARRLTKRELSYTLRDLLKIDADVTAGIPDEVEAGSFDTVGSAQRISAVHMESYLDAADDALDLAIRLGRNPTRSQNTSYIHLEAWHDKPANLGGSITRKLKFGDGVVLFRDVDYLTQFQFGVRETGVYRLTARIAAYQTDKPLTAKLIVKSPTGAATLVKAIDLTPGEPYDLEVETVLHPGDTPYMTYAMGGKEPFAAIQAAGGTKNYKGRGLALMSQRVEGPLVESWPPPSTTELLDGIPIESHASGAFRVGDSNDVLGDVRTVVRHFVEKALRRSVSPAEVDRFVELARPAVDEGRGFQDAVRIPLRSILSSPQFLLFGGAPGTLSDFDLASRLSYFLWKSMPDEELLQLAAAGQLGNKKVLASQVERMLDDPKSQRFVKDFVGQWLRLYKVNVTSPDAGLYPEFDELLSTSIPRETEAFFAYQIDGNQSLLNLIDSDYTFLNRRLAEHYGIEGVKGQEFRRVELPADSIRGGILTQAAILKTTANGTTTSPVMRGNFVLTNFLGTPPSPPPPGVGSIEPDTRGRTTIREILSAHREIETCNLCHREIDPPGFALESFDPIGGYREHYRASGGEQTFGEFTVPLPPKQGPEVDATGVTANGKPFDGIREFKQHLLDQQDQIARNYLSQLLVYATGAEIQFADRNEIEEILSRTSDQGYLMRDLIHEVVQSHIFRNK